VRKLLLIALLVVGLGLAFTPREELERALGWVGGEGDFDRRTFWCPMDPAIVRAGEGLCPICGMTLTLFEGGAPAESGVLQLSERQVQQAGVRLGTAEVRELAHALDTTGKLELDPGARATVRLPHPGRSVVETVRTLRVGERVEETTVLCEVSNAALDAKLAQYRVALDDYARLRRERSESGAAQALERMRGLREDLLAGGLSAAALSAWVASDEEGVLRFPVVAGRAGTVVEDSGLVAGDVLSEGARILELADLDRLWLSVELWEQDRPFVRAGQRIEFTTRAVPDRRFETTVHGVEPIVRTRTQTTRALAIVANAGGLLAPGQFVRARVTSSVGRVLAVPESAVLQSGRRDVALVAEGGGRFRPRLLELGRRHLFPGEPGESFGARDERYHEVLAGLRDGERVVVAGNFLLNAEAQFQGLLGKMIAAHEAQAGAAELAPREADALDRVLEAYLSIGAEFVADRGERLESLARELERSAREGAAAGAALRPRIESLAATASTLASASIAPEPDWDELRTSFGSLSRDVVTLLRDFRPLCVAEGELFVFRCPMAEDFGFDLWVQSSAELANPYMGQRMVDCGVPAALE